MDPKDRASLSDADRRREVVLRIPSEEPRTPMVTTYCLLALAISVEVCGTLSVRQSDGFTKFVWVVSSVVCYSGALYLLSVVLARGMAMSVVYAIWSAVGVMLVSLIDAAFFGTRLHPTQLAGLFLLILGVVFLHIGPLQT